MKERVKKVFVICNNKALSKAIAFSLMTKTNYEVIEKNYDNGFEKISRLAEKRENIDAAIVGFHKRFGNYAEVASMVTTINNIFLNAKVIALVKDKEEEQIAKLLRVFKIMRSPGEIELNKLYTEI